MIVHNDMNLTLRKQALTNPNLCADGTYHHFFDIYVSVYTFMDLRGERGGGGMLL